MNMLQRGCVMMKIQQALEAEPDVNSELAAQIK